MATFDAGVVLCIFGFAHERIQIGANIEFKKKDSLLVKQWDREKAVPQTEQLFHNETYFFFFFFEAHLIKG